VDDARLVENLVYTYAERIDAGDLDGVADLFAHGRIHGVEGGGPETVFEGRDAVRRLYGATTRIHPETGTPRTRHLTTNVHVVVLTGGVAEGAGTARASSYFTVLQATETLPLQPIITGRYRDTFHVVAGEWCFESRTMTVEAAGDLSQHLLI